MQPLRVQNVTVATIQRERSRSVNKKKIREKKQTSGSVYFEKTKIINEEREALFLLLKSSHKAKPYKSISGHDPKSPGCYWLGAYLHKV